MKCDIAVQQNVIHEPTPVFLPRESLRRSLTGCGPPGHKESDTTEATWHAAHRKEWHIDACYSMIEPWKYQWKKPATKGRTYDSIRMKCQNKPLRRDSKGFPESREDKTGFDKEWVEGLFFGSWSHSGIRWWWLNWTDGCITLGIY